MVATKKRILITGSSGMLGTELRALAPGEPYEVYGTDVKRPVEQDGSVHFHQLDITDQSRTVALLESVKPHIVIHAAAYTDVDSCQTHQDAAYAVNAAGTEHIARGCEKIDASLIYVSTDFVFDGGQRRPYREDDVPNPLNVYGASKLKGEQSVQKILKHFTIVRSSWLFGYHGKNFVDTILKKAVDGNALSVVFDQVGSPTYARDLATALLILAERGSDPRSSGIFHVTNGGSVSWFDFTLDILACAGIKGTQVTAITSRELGRPARRPKMSVLDNTRYEEATGRPMRHYKEALQEYITQRSKQ